MTTAQLSFLEALTVQAVAKREASGTDLGFEFTGEGCEPDPNYKPPDWLLLPSDDPEWQPKGRMG